MELLYKTLGLDIDSINRAKYNANSDDKKISEVIIDGVSIKGYNAFSFVRKLSYIDSPVRSLDGTIGNLDSYPVFSTPQLQIDFSLLFIDSYRDIMNLIYTRREHLVECYDIVRDTRVVERMYFEPEELPKLFTITRKVQGHSDNVIELLGVQDYTVIMVGTNNPTSNIKVTYYDRKNNIIGNIYSVENTDIVIGDGVSVEDIDGYIFNNQWERIVFDGADTIIKEPTYINNEAYNIVLKYPEETATKTISFRAKYKDTIEYTLSLSYGIGKPFVDMDGKEIYTIPFVPNDTLGQALDRANIQLHTGGVLDTLEGDYSPTIEIDGLKYTTHLNRHWYFTPQVSDNMISRDTVLGWNSDMIVYNVYEPVKKTVTFDSNGGLYNYEPLVDVPYGSNVVLPIPYRKDYTFDGWYLSHNMSKKFDGIMLPRNITLVAKWIENV